jgi:primosomal protein N'
MSDFITLSCPPCGGKLEITQDIERFACSHCGGEHVVRRGGGIVSLAPIVAGLKQVQVGVDKTASELAIQRLTGEILELQQALATAEAKARSVQADGKQAMNTALPGILLVLLTPIFGACCLATIGGQEAQPALR